MLRALSVPAGNDRGPLFMDQVLAAIHQGNPRKLPITLVIVRHAGEVTLAVDFPDECRAVVERQLYAHYPEAKLVSVSPEELPISNACATTAEVELQPDIFPMRRYQQFEDPLSRQVADPLTALFTALATDTTPGLQAAIHFTIAPAHHGRIHRIQKCIRILARPFFLEHHRLAAGYRRLALSPRLMLRWSGWIFGRIVSHRTKPAVNLHVSETRLHEREDDLVAANEKAGKLLFATTITIRITAPRTAEAEARTKVREIAATFGQFSAPRRNVFRLRRTSKRQRSHTFLLATDELATLWHPATSGVQSPTMKIVESREAEPPVRLPSVQDYPDLAILGQAAFRSSRQSCGLLSDDRRRHLLIQGKTGMGKSTLLHRLIASDISAGRGTALIDPHGDLCEGVLASVPSHRTNDTVLFDATDTAHPLAFNILHCPNPQHRALTATGVVGAFKKLWPDFFGPRMEHVFLNALLALLEVEGTTLVSVVRLLSEARFREAITARVSDPVVRHYWEREFAPMPPKFRAEVVSPVQNKVGQIVSNPLLRNILGQAKSTLDLRKTMDERKVLLVNLSKGRIGEIASSLLGSFLVTAIQQAAMTRAEVVEQDRTDFYLFIDEFQNFATESFGTILSEARKYRLNLTIANQYLGQLDEALLNAVWGNIGSMVIFQVGVQDAEVLATQLGGKLLPGDLLTLPRYQAYARLLINGHPSRPFTLRTLSPLTPSRNNRERPHVIRRYCRQRYGRPAANVEREIQHALAAA